MPKPKQTDFITIRGTVNFAKILGAPMDNYDGDGKEWKMDLIPLDEEGTRARLRKLGVADRLRQKEEYLDGAPHMTLRQKANKPDGTENDPPEVVDVTGEAWNPKKLLGNGTVVDVKLRVADYGKGFKKGIYINGVRVLELVPYNRPAFDDLDEDDPYYKAAQAAKKAKQRQTDDEEDFDAEPENEAEEEEEVREERPARGRQATGGAGRRRAAPVDDDELDDDVPF